MFFTRIFDSDFAQKKYLLQHHLPRKDEIACLESGKFSLIKRYTYVSGGQTFRLYSHEQSVILEYVLNQSKLPGVKL